MKENNHKLSILWQGLGQWHVSSTIWHKSYIWSFTRYDNVSKNRNINKYLVLIKYLPRETVTSSSLTLTMMEMVKSILKIFPSASGIFWRPAREEVGLKFFQVTSLQRTKFTGIKFRNEKFYFYFQVVFNLACYQYKMTPAPMKVQN